MQADWTDDYSVEAMADDLAALLEVLGEGPLPVVGHSLGGMVALAAAAARPEPRYVVVASRRLWDRPRRIGQAHVRDSRAVLWLQDPEIGPQPTQVASRGSRPNPRSRTPGVTGRGRGLCDVRHVEPLTDPTVLATPATSRWTCPTDAESSRA